MRRSSVLNRLIQNLPAFPHSYIYWPCGLNFRQWAQRPWFNLRSSHFKKWFFISFCLALSIISNVSRIKWSNPGIGIVLFSTTRCRSYWKGKLLDVLDHGFQLYFFIFIYLSIYIYIFFFLCVCVCVPVKSCQRPKIMSEDYSRIEYMRNFI